MHCPNGLRFETVELPWKNNTRSVSCIPKGVYTCIWTYSPRFKRKMYLLEDVPDRSGIRIHKGNLPQHFEGCIGLGLKTGYIAGKKGVLNSAVAVEQFEKYMDGKTFKLVITGEGYEYGRDS